MANLRHWQMQTAKARFSELFERARREGPQRVTRRGRDAVVVVSEEQYERLCAKGRGKLGLASLLAASPLQGMDLDLERPSDYGRTVKL